VLSVEEFKQYLLLGEKDHLLDEVLLTPEAAHVSPGNISFLRRALSQSFSLSDDVPVDVWIVGSAKLGFATREKVKNGVILPRYRPFSGDSDVDVAVISNTIFGTIWHELAEHAHRATRLPWNSAFLGDYLVCGWLRPDHFPNQVRLRHCDAWWDLFRRLSRERCFGPRRVRGGLFADISHLRRYLKRSIEECEQAEKLTI
jgi:hypothetical protein